MRMLRMRLGKESLCTFSTAIFAITWCLEKVCMTLFNLAIAKFLTLLMFNNHFMTVVTVYLLLQTLPLIVISLYIGVWIDTVNRRMVVSRTLGIRAVTSILTLLFCAVLVTLHPHVNILATVPLLMFLIVTSVVTGALHLVIHIATQRMWVVNIAQRCGNASRYLLHCNSVMSIARDIGHLGALAVFDGLTKHVTPLYMFLTIGVVVSCATLNQWLCFKTIDQTHLTKQVTLAVGQRRSLRRSVAEFMTHPEAPIGLCWAARSSFTTVWLAAAMMEHCIGAIPHRLVYFGCAATTSLFYMKISPYFGNHAMIMSVSILEIVLVAMATTSVLLATVQDTVNGGSLIRAAEYAYQNTGPITITEIKQEACDTVTLVLGYLGMGFGAMCMRVWNLTALQIYQEEAAPHMRGTVGGVQLSLDQCLLSVHAFLAVFLSGKQYAVTCAVIGAALTCVSCAVLIYWNTARKVRYLPADTTDSEEAHYNLAFQETDT